MFHDADDEQWVTLEDGLEQQEDALRGELSAGDEACERAANDQDGGLDSWEYTSSFADVDGFYDDFDTMLVD